MIYFETKGGIKRDRILAYKVIKFCIKKLLPRHRNLYISCTLTNTLKDGMYGWCMDSYEKKTYEIGIHNRLSRDGVLLVSDGVYDFITTVCHEMVHVMQYATKKYIQSDASFQMWKCKDSKYRNYARTDYDKQPWETQAYAMEYSLAEEFIETCL